MKQGFTLIMTIYFMLALATIGGIMLSLGAITTKQTSDSYLYEQAQLLARSSAEYAMLAISAHDRTAGNCINNINAQYPDANNPIFDINISIRYIGLGAYVAGANECASYIDTIQTPESNGTILLDVIVRSNDNLSLSEPIVYHKRTLQKP